MSDSEIENSNYHNVEIIFENFENDADNNNKYLIYISTYDGHIAQCICYKGILLGFYEDTEEMYKTQLVKIKKHNVLEIINCISVFITWIPSLAPVIRVFESSKNIMSIPDYYLSNKCGITMFFKNGESCKTKHISKTYSLKNLLHIMDFISAPVIFHKFVFILDNDGCPDVVYSTKNYVESTYFDIFFGGFVFEIGNEFEYKTLSNNKRKLLEYIETHYIRKYYIYDVNDNELDECYENICANECILNVHNYIKLKLLEIRNDNHNNKTCDIVTIDISEYTLFKYDNMS